MKIKHLVCLLFLMKLSVRLHAHPWGGLVVDSEGFPYFVAVDPIDAYEHYACVWKVVEKDSIESSLRSNYSPSDVIVLRTADYQVFAAERFGTYPNFNSNLWEKKTGWEKRISTVDSSFHVQAVLNDGHGTVYFARGNQLWKRDSSAHVKPFAETATFDRIDGMAWGKNGRMYIMEKSQVSYIEPNGNVKVLASNLRTESPEHLPFCGGNILLDMAVDELENVYVAYFGNRQLLKITKEGDVSVFLQARGVWTPHGVDVFEGDIYVLESTVGTGTTDILPRVRVVVAGEKVVTVYRHPKASNVEAQYERDLLLGKGLWLVIGVVIIVVLIVTNFGRGKRKS